jgi:hypothetical protein
MVDGYYLLKQLNDRNLGLLTTKNVQDFIAYLQKNTNTAKFNLCSYKTAYFNPDKPPK